MSNKLTHVNENGKINMVDVGNKAITVREATSSGVIKLDKATIALILQNNIKKGDVIATAKIAGILAAKKTSDIIPLCHNILINKVEINIEVDEENSQLIVTSLAKTKGTTGIELESLMATSGALLCIYDMVKAVDKNAIISDIKLLHKIGGKSGEFIRK